MPKNILIISSSPRKNSNSHALAKAFAEGAREAGHAVELVSLQGKAIGFCRGCLACQKTHKCVLNDDAVAIAEKVMNADTLVFVTPIYYYEMSGQMKTLLDRLNPLYSTEYQFRKVYMLSVAAEDEAFVPEKAVSGLQGWVDCFEKAEFVGSLFCGGINEPAEASGRNEERHEAYAFGEMLQ